MIEIKLFNSSQNIKSVFDGLRQNDLAITFISTKY